MKRHDIAGARALLVAALFAIPAFGADDPAARGESVYKASKCATCHAADGSGNTPVGKSLKVRDLRSKEVQSMKDEDLASVIKNGKNKMPSYKTLSDADIACIVAYIRKLGS